MAQTHIPLSAWRISYTLGDECHEHFFSSRSLRITMYLFSARSTSCIQGAVETNSGYRLTYTALACCPRPVLSLAVFNVSVVTNSLHLSLLPSLQSHPRRTLPTRAKAFRCLIEHERSVHFYRLNNKRHPLPNYLATSQTVHCAVRIYDSRGRPITLRCAFYPAL